MLDKWLSIKFDLTSASNFCTPNDSPGSRGKQRIPFFKTGKEIRQRFNRPTKTEC